MQSTSLSSPLPALPFTLRSQRMGSNQEYISQQEGESGVIFEDEDIQIEDDYTTDTRDDTDGIFDSDDEYEQYSSELDNNIADLNIE